MIEYPTKAAVQGPGRGKSDMSMIRMDLTQVVISRTSDAQVIVLKERDGHRSFPILIGTVEAAAIDRGLQEQRTPRPMTHDLVNNILDALGVELERVVINDMRDKTYYAKLVLKADGRTLEVDSRPSDAIAVACLRNTPIYAEEKVLQAVCKGDDFD